MTETQAASQIEQLEAQAAFHKTEMRKHKALLRWTLSQREQFARDCERAGIKIILKQKGEEGDLHGRNTDPRSH